MCARERERERESEWGRGRENGKERILSRLHTQHGAWFKAQSHDCEIMNWTDASLIKSPTLTDGATQVPQGPHIFGTYQYITLHSKSDFADANKLRILRWGDYSEMDYLGEPSVITRILKWWKREVANKTQRFEYMMFLALSMGEGIVSQWMLASSRSWTRHKVTDRPWSPQMNAALLTPWL